MIKPQSLKLSTYIDNNIGNCSNGSRNFRKIPNRMQHDHEKDVASGHDDFIERPKSMCRVLWDI